MTTEKWFPPDVRLANEPEPRFELMRFACHMETRLRHRGQPGQGWHNSPNEFLVRELHGKLSEVVVALVNRANVCDDESKDTMDRWLRDSLADLADTAMMMFDNSIEGRTL